MSVRQGKASRGKDTPDEASSRPVGKSPQVTEKAKAEAGAGSAWGKPRDTVPPRSPHAASSSSNGLAKAKAMAKTTSINIAALAARNLGGFVPNKIFVGGVPIQSTEDQFKIYFERFGAISKVELHALRGFGYITYESVESVDACLEKYEEHYLCKKWVEVKRSIPRELIDSYEREQKRLEAEFKAADGDVVVEEPPSVKVETPSNATSSAPAWGMPPPAWGSPAAGGPGLPGPGSRRPGGASGAGGGGGAPPREEPSGTAMVSHITQLKEMGFSEEVARRALSRCVWDVNKAIDHLLTTMGAEDEDGDAGASPSAEDPPLSAAPVGSAPSTPSAAGTTAAASAAAAAALPPEAQSPLGSPARAKETVAWGKSPQTAWGKPAAPETVWGMPKPAAESAWGKAPTAWGKSPAPQQESAWAKPLGSSPPATAMASPPPSAKAPPGTPKSAPSSKAGSKSPAHLQLAPSAAPTAAAVNPSQAATVADSDASGGGYPAPKVAVVAKAEAPAAAVSEGAGKADATAGASPSEAPVAATSSAPPPHDVSPTATGAPAERESPDAGVDASADVSSGAAKKEESEALSVNGHESLASAPKNQPSPEVTDLAAGAPGNALEPETLAPAEEPKPDTSKGATDAGETAPEESTAIAVAATLLAAEGDDADGSSSGAAVVPEPQAQAPPAVSPLESKGGLPEQPTEGGPAGTTPPRKRVQRMKRPWAAEDPSQLSASEGDFVCVWIDTGTDHGWIHAERLTNLDDGATKVGWLPVCVLLQLPENRRWMRAKQQWQAMGESQCSVEEAVHVIVWIDSRTGQGWVYVEAGEDVNTQPGWLPEFCLEWSDD